MERYLFVKVRVMIRMGNYVWQCHQTHGFSCSSVHSSQVLSTFFFSPLPTLPFRPTSPQPQTCFNYHSQLSSTSQRTEQRESQAQEALRRSLRKMPHCSHGGCLLHPRRLHCRSRKVWLWFWSWIQGHCPLLLLLLFHSILNWVIVKLRKIIFFFNWVTCLFHSG